ncbi:hypothetical protein Tco_0505370 [Tanacetum coccineum]
MRPRRQFVFAVKIVIVEAAEAARASELNAVLEGQVAALESSAILSCDELSIKDASLEFDKDKLIDQVSQLEGTCSGLRDEVMGYKLFKEQIEAVQDVQVKVLSDRVAELDANLMGMALHLDEEFCPRYLTTIVGRRWILSRGLKLVVMKCLQSPEYLAALGGAIGHAIDKGMQVGLAAGIDHGKARRDLTDVVAYDPSGRLIICPAAETLEAIQLQPSPKQLMLPIHLLEDQVVIGETSLSFSLDVANARVQRLKRNDASEQLSIYDALVPLIEPISIENLVGEASTFRVLAKATTTTLSTTFIQANTVPPVSVTDHEVSDVGPSTKVSSPPAIVF